MAHLLQSTRNQLRVTKPAFNTFHHPNNPKPLPSVDQIRFKASTRQTGGGKGKSSKTSENRSAQTKGYLKKSKSGDENTGGKSDRYDVIRQILYDQDPEMTDAVRFERLRTIIPEYEIHETIDRAWKLYERHQREKQASELEKQYRSMNHALEELRQTDLKSYLKIVKLPNGSVARLQNIFQTNGKTNININSTGKLSGLFPRQIKLPTESLPSSDKVWDLNWKNPIDPLS